MTEKIRLQRYLASAGVAARRKAEELIVAGQVRVNGKQVRLLGTKVDVRDHITVNGEAVHLLDNFYVLLNKPKGCVTAVEDDRDRPTVMEYLPNIPIPVRPVGRLDFYAEGVVLLTNDGDLASRLVSSERHIPKTYHVKVRGEVDRDHLAVLREGVRLEDGTTTLPAEVNFLPGESRHAWLAITVVENKQHQVQRMMEALGYQVQKLQCVAFANLTFHGLRVGDARELTQLELNALRDLVDLDHSAAARGAWRTYREDTDIPRRAREKVRAEAAEAEGDAPLPPIDDDDSPPEAFRRPARKDARGPARKDARGPSRDARSDARRPGRDDARRPAARPGRDDARRPAARPGRDDARGPARSDERSFDKPRSTPTGRPSRPGARGPARSDDRSFGKPRSSAPTGRPSRPGARGPSRPDARGPSRPDARGPSRPDARGAARSDDRSFGKPRSSTPTGRPSRPDARGPSRPDARGPSRPDARGPSRPDSRGPARADTRSFGQPRSSAPTGRSARSGDRGPARSSASTGRPARAGQNARPSSARPPRRK